MARIRSVHPGQWKSGEFLECSPLARLLALALRNIADDHGVFRWKPKTIKAECLPADNCEIDALLAELIANEQVKRYASEGKDYGIILDFTQWQRPKKPKYVHPVPEWFSTSTEPLPNESGTDTENPPQRKEVGGRREEEEESSRSVAKATRPDASDFEEFWKAYPRRDGPNPRKPAESKFIALVKTGVDPAVMIGAARELTSQETARGNIGTRFIPQAITWLSQQRWSDHAAVAFASDVPKEVDWDAVCESYKKYGIWSKHAPGNDPGSPSCLCPPEILEKHGLLPNRSAMQ